METKQICHEVLIIIELEVVSTQWMPILAFGHCTNKKVNVKAFILSLCYIFERIC